MVFLEAMAMGKCVVAYDDATMNEYIHNGEDGILFSGREVGPITEGLISYVRNNVRQSTGGMRLRWLVDAEKINSFIEAQLPQTPSFIRRFKIAVAYPLFLMEGTLYVMKNYLRSLWLMR